MVGWVAVHSSLNLSRFARDILSIPGGSTTDFLLLFITNVSSFLCFYAGSAVAVERIFQEAVIQISLRRASLNPETIRTLMLVKHGFLACTAIMTFSGD